MHYFIRFNGVGNAWPVKLGEMHSFYGKQFRNLSNASYSIICANSDKLNAENIAWEILIDAGHGTVQNLIRGFNRIPEAIFITHPHFDHILGLDWVIQSYYRKTHKKYPVYATKLCWQQTIQTIPHLKEMVDFNEIQPGEWLSVKLAGNIKVCPLPVFHGIHAPGASMLHFKFNNLEKKLNILFTGDVLYPLLRKKDLESLKNINYCIADSNNRFPYPKSNHWSLTHSSPDDYKGFEYYNDYMDIEILDSLIQPHLSNEMSNSLISYFDEFKEDYLNDKNLLINSVIVFLVTISCANFFPVHYSGSEDEKYYKQKILNSTELQKWLNELFLGNKMALNIKIPSSNDIYELIPE